tara:strand:+ start:437 stop:1465 length:1029 start_codon:yes stop_codon:yes gene_type:complete
MAEVTREGTSPITTADAVNLLLTNPAPETDNAELAEEQPTQEIETEPEAAETDDEVEVETEEVDDDGEEVETDEPEPDEETESDEVVERVEQTFRVRVGDEEIDVTQDELVNSYMRNADYTRKSQYNAEVRKQAEAELEAVKADRQRYADQLGQLQQALSQQEPPQEYWDNLYNEDPLEYTRQKDLARDRKDSLAQVEAERQRVQQEQAAQIQAEQKKHLEAEKSRLTELIPEWLDAEVANKEATAVVKYAQRQGYSQDELAKLSDSRAVSVLRKAMKYDVLMSKKPVAQKKAKAAPKMTKSGQPKTTKQSNQRRKRDALANIRKQKGRGAMDAAVDFLISK